MMLLESLKALVNAATDALQATCSLPVTSASISQLDQGSLTFPAIGDLSMAGASIHRIHLGCDSLLCGRLAELEPSDGSASGIEVLAERFVAQLVEEIPGRNPRGSLENLAVEPLTLRTRGVRTFGFRLETAAGQFFLLAEVPSRMEWEQNRGSEFAKIMAESYLPEGWISREELAGKGEIENFLVFLRKLEADVTVVLPTASGESVSYSATLIEQCSHEGERALRFAMKLPDSPQDMPFPGTEVLCKVGLEDRSLEFVTCFMSRESYPVVGGTSILSGLFSVPETLRISQHRQSFRIPIDQSIPVDITVPEAEAPSLWRKAPGPEITVQGELADLSFSGARVTLDRNELAGCLESGTHASCRLSLPGVASRVELAAIVRRVVTVNVESGSPCEEAGIEFLPIGQQDDGVLETVREYVLSEQRSWLARRIQVAGVGDW